MRTNTRILIAVLLAAGMAQAAWNWSPTTAVLKQPDSARTAFNNARCIVASENAINVVFVRNVKIGAESFLKVYYTRSTNLGLDWSTPYPLSGSDAYDCMSPSIGMWDDDNLLVIWNECDKEGHPHEGATIKSAQSTDGGGYWVDAGRVNTDENYACSHPALYCEVSTSSPEWSASVVWAESLWSGDNPQRIGQNAGEVTGGTISWLEDENSIVNGPSGAGPQLNFPSVWSSDHVLHTAFEQCDVIGGPYGGDTLMYDSNEYPGTDWPDPERVEYPRPEEYARKCAHPSNECCRDTEMIAYERPGGSTPHYTVTWLTRRGWNGGNPGIWLFSPGPLWGYWPGDSCLRPQLFGTYVSGSEHSTVFLTATGFHRTANSNLSQVYVLGSNDQFNTWFPVSGVGTPFRDSTDSCSVYAKAYNTTIPEVPIMHRVWVAATGHQVYAGNVSTSTVMVAMATDLPFSAQTNARGARQLVRGPGSNYLHRIRSVANYVSYERSSDNGTTWDFQSAPDFGTNPTLALYGGYPVICYLRDDTVFSARMNSDSAWSIKTIFAGSSTYVPGIPSLAVFPNAGAGSRMANACFPVYDHNTGGSSILLAQFDTASTGGVVLDTISQNPYAYGDSAVTVVVGLTDTIETCFEHGDSIFYKYLRFSPTAYGQPDTWTKYTLVNAGGTNAQHPQVEKIGNWFYVTYSEHWTDGGSTIWAIKRACCNDQTDVVNWEGTGPVSDVNVNRKDYPSISSANAVAWAESSSTTNHWVIKANIADSMLDLTPSDTNCKFVSLLCDTAVQTTPSTSTTGVYYLWLQQYSGDTWTVPFAQKSVLTSNADANVTRYNQGRKLALDHNDSLSSVFRTQQGSIYYSKKKDGVEGWNSSLLRNTGDMPAVATDYLNRVYVADRDFQGTSPMYDVIRCQTRASGSSTWTDFQVYSSLLPGAGGSNHKIGPPSIVACLNDTGGLGRTAAYIVYTVYETTGMAGTSTTCMSKVSSTGVVYTETLFTALGKIDSFPSIAVHPTAGKGYGLHLAYQSNGEVYARKTLNQDQPEFTTKRTWSSGYNLSNTLISWSRHPIVAADSDSVVVSWVEGDSGRVLVKGQTPGFPYNIWGDSVNVSKCKDTVCDYPSIALGDSIIVTYQKKLSSTNYDVIARVNFHSNLNITNSSTNSKYPHCLFHLHDGSPVISTVWTEELSTNYAEVGYKRWQLGVEGGGGSQSASVFDPSIRPCLFAPSPNPFAGTTTIRYQTNIQGRTSVVIHDVTGRRVCNLMTTYQRPGIYNLTWTGRDDRQRLLPEGIYFVRLQTPNYSEARKLILTQ